MGIHRIKSKHLVRLGFEKGMIAGLALDLLRKHFKRVDPDETLAKFAEFAANPEAFRDDIIFGTLAEKMLPEPEAEPPKIYNLLDAPKGYRSFGVEGIDEGTFKQMDTAMRLPITRGGALMADAHVGYGLPIGGVLATEGVVIPYAVGMDIGCRMCLSIFDIPHKNLEREKDRLSRVLKSESRFGKDVFEQVNDAEVLENQLFAEIELLKKLQGTAARQLGSSGSGNHFVEFGRVELLEDSEDLGLKAGAYFGLLTHSGSRALGATIAQHYTDIARQKCRLPKGAGNLSWLDLDTEAGQEYWLAMNLAGDYASACHHDIHYRIRKALDAKLLSRVENHHNFAWKEKLQTGEDVIVHRKGATPASKGEMGIIPGSMLEPGFIVRGKGLGSALNSASHGAGRRFSRSHAMSSFTRSQIMKQLDKAGIILIGGNVDEAPDAYKNIHEVMAAQKDLVDSIASFQPKIVRMDRE